jgi:hypothetical protein
MPQRRLLGGLTRTKGRIRSAKRQVCDRQDTNNNQGCCLMCTSKNMQPPMCDAVSDLFVHACVRE